ncbi:SOS response-associated peptidase [Leptospira sp. id769339]|uniref:SOS response-associated peptidase n=1 Tax=Leptospira sp. id769339 TaxID=2864221 RepID=UPI00214AEE68|nr:SOS response-associated peptidase [Leptospira sp. id769339]MCR1795531.1 SOS response-associated peptidase [Leptospira sp. id769339]
MCGRYSLNASASQVIEYFNLRYETDQIRREFREEKEVFPTNVEPVVRASDGIRILDKLSWGVKYDWNAKEQINARFDRLHSSPIWSKLIKRKRCIIPATAYWEWNENEPKGNNRYEIFPLKSDILPFAGITDTFIDRKGIKRTGFIVITMDANPHIAKIHDRQPGMILPENIDAWLDDSIVDPRELIYHATENELEFKKVPNVMDQPGYGQGR